MEDELNILDEDGLNYAIFVFGSAHWHSLYDIVNTSYNLTTVGLAYSKHLTTLISNVSADLNTDGKVDIQDLTIIISDFGKTSGFNNPKSDTNADGIVDIFDVVYVASRFT
jgi:hypothetical protein